VVWTVPPSQAVLDEMISKNHPGQVFWFGVLPAENEPDFFLKTTAQILKRAIAEGPTTFDLDELATRLAATREAVDLALHWFAARGDIAIQQENERIIQIMANGETNPMLQNELKTRLQKSLAEIQAYRRFYLKCAIDTLVERS
jgi:hypothetical protein